MQFPLDTQFRKSKNVNCIEIDMHPCPISNVQSQRNLTGKFPSPPSHFIISNSSNPECEQRYVVRSSLVAAAGNGSDTRAAIIRIPGSTMNAMKEEGRKRGEKGRNRIDEKGRPLRSRDRIELAQFHSREPPYMTSISKVVFT